MIDKGLKRRRKDGGSATAKRPPYKTISSESVYEKIKCALENPKYKYRTISGIAKELNINRKIVESELSQHPSEVVVLYRKSQNGERLITTRQHYKNKASLREKVMGVMMSRIY